MDTWLIHLFGSALVFLSDLFLSQLSPRLKTQIPFKIKTFIHKGHWWSQRPTTERITFPGTSRHRLFLQFKHKGERIGRFRRHVVVATLVSRDRDRQLSSFLGGERWYKVRLRHLSFCHSRWVLVSAGQDTVPSGMTKCWI